MILLSPSGAEEHSESIRQMIRAAPQRVYTPEWQLVSERGRPSMRPVARVPLVKAVSESYNRRSNGEHQAGRF